MAVGTKIFTGSPVLTSLINVVIVHALFSAQTFLSAKSHIVSGHQPHPGNFTHTQQLPVLKSVSHFKKRKETMPCCGKRQRNY